MRKVRLISGATLTIGSKIREATALLEVTTDLVSHEELPGLVRNMLDQEEERRTCPRSPRRTNLMSDVCIVKRVNGKQVGLLYLIDGREFTLPQAKQGLHQRKERQGIGQQ